MGKTNAEKCKSYRVRKKQAKVAHLVKQGLSVPVKKVQTSAERSRSYRLRKRINPNENQLFINGAACDLLVPAKCVITTAPTFQPPNTSIHSNYLEAMMISRKIMDQNKMATQHNAVSSSVQETTIKEESDMSENIEVKQEQLIEEPIDIKCELEIQDDAPTRMEHSLIDIQLELKEEIPDKDFGRPFAEDQMIKVTINPEPYNDFNTETIIGGAYEQGDEEKVVPDDLVSYDFPNFDDSMDSNEATALCHVEACLHDAGHQGEGDFQLPQSSSAPYDSCIYPENSAMFVHKIMKKMDGPKKLPRGRPRKLGVTRHEQPQVTATRYKEKKKLHRFIKDSEKGRKQYNKNKQSDPAVTETHLISNKLINTTSTVTNPRDGIVESQTTKTLIMEIHPVCQSEMDLKLGSPEEILPTSDYSDYKDTFQLNSITGNVLSLEQQAYGLLNTKKSTIHERNHKCPHCPASYMKKCGLTNHLKIHETIKRRATGVIQGLKTRKANRKKKLELVKSEEEKPLKKETVAGHECACSKVFRRKSSMITCMKSHGVYEQSPFACSTCKQEFTREKDLSSHRRRHHRKRFHCKFCPIDCDTRKELFKHLQAHQKLQLSEYKLVSEVVKEDKKLKCFICSKVFSELSGLKSHVMGHHKPPYKCPHCKQTYEKIVDFANHTKTSHQEVEVQCVLDVLTAFSELVKAWKCEECGMQFHDAKKLAQHEIDDHYPGLKDDEKFQCDVCERVFVTNQGLLSHHRMHEKEIVAEPEPEQVTVMCLECRKICVDENALASHMRLHSPERKFRCRFCDYRFTTHSKRRKHAEIHTGRMRYVCFICEYQCSSQNRLNMHKMSVKHSNMKEFLLTGKAPDVEPKSKVKITIRKEERVKKKKKEIESVIEVDVPCDICGEKFPSESVMLEHKQTHPFIEFPNDDKPSRIFFK